MLESNNIDYTALYYLDKAVYMQSLVFLTIKFEKQSILWKCQSFVCNGFLLSFCVKTFCYLIEARN